MPLGPYPHPRLCGHTGMTPNKIRTKKMRTIVPSDTFALLCQRVKLQPAVSVLVGGRDGDIVDHLLNAVYIVNELGGQIPFSTIFGITA